MLNVVLFRSELCLCHCFHSSRLLYRLTIQPSLFASLLSLLFVLMSGVMISDRSSTHTSGAVVTFLPNDAQMACRAILPQCFRRSDWADLCAREPIVAHGRPEACRAAGFEQGQSF